MNRRDNLEITIDSGGSQVTIKSKNCLKVLGVQLDSYLTFKSHAAQVKRRASNAIRNIARSNNVLSLPSRKLLTNALVVPHYNYGDIIYDGCSAEAKKELERSQAYAAKALLGRSKFSSTTNALTELKWIPLEQRRKIHQGVFMHKALHHRSSHHAIATVFSLFPQHNHSTRQKASINLNYRQHRTSSFQRSTIYKATLAWNSFPKDIRRIEDTTNFKERLQRHYIEKYLKDSNHVE